MKIKLLMTSVVVALGISGPANAAFTVLSDGNYVLEITGGCFAFGNCVTSGTGALVDNSNLIEQQTDITFNTTTGNLPAGTYGSGIADDGLMGIIEFSLSAGNIVVSNYSQDSYLDTPGGTFYLDGDTTTMHGTIDNIGNMIFNPTGRHGLAGDLATSLGHNSWNTDDTSDGFGTGLTEVWTTDTSTSRVDDGFDPFTLNGQTLTDDGAGGWTGVLVSAGNMGSSWGFLDNQQYSECYQVTIRGEGSPASSIPNSDVGCSTASVVPIPAAVWLFGSGLLGLIGVARRKA